MVEKRPTGQEQQRTTSELAGKRARALVDLLVGDWRPSEQQVLQWIRIAVAVGSVLLVVLLILYIVGLVFGIPFLDLLKILAVPITLGAAVPLLNWLQKQRELEREAQRTRDTAAQQYLDQLTEFLLDKKDNRLVRVDVTDDTRDVISARTEAILRHLDKENQQSLVEFLHGLGLLNREDEPVVSLAGLDFAGIDWSRADLRSTDLREVELSFVNLEGADLEDADLELAHLLGANLRSANLTSAFLADADLEQADLTKATLDFSVLSGAELVRANLTDATLSKAHLGRTVLHGATLRNAILLEADLSEAQLALADLTGAIFDRSDLTGADVTTEQLFSCKSLEGVTMPNGQKYEDWLKSSRGDGENSRPL